MVRYRLEEEYEAKVKELQQRHELELQQQQALDQNGTGGTGGLSLESLSIGNNDDDGGHHSSASSSVPSNSGSNSHHPTDDDDDEKRRAKKKLERLRAKREAERARALERERAMQDELATAGPTRRDLELQAILSMVQPLGYTVQPVTADGHCLYRAIAGHVASVPSSMDPMNFQTIRA
jgi:hypothetical protein